ncbi:MAG: carbohydrate kinase family protein, partial [Thiohalomonadaceae bacterium]
TVAALRNLPCPHFMDVNLREPWWQQAQVHAMLEGLRWAKLNEDELRQLGFAGDSEIAARAMREHFGIELLILTLGEAGALLITEDELLRGRPVPVRRLVDTVGAGDAFSAVMLLGILHNWPVAQSLQRALAFAAAQCEVQGAIHEDRSVYEKFLSQWGAAA